ncbi:MAG: SDR family NAD(P)-dependent oxidoreductase [Ferruginibacter sp.]|nr:SDR family NAD(P)-dependent oxidoreductase [Ferruginibacter sp.]
MQVQDSVVVITGAARGIGEAAALGLASMGAKIVLCDLNEEKLKAVCNKIIENKGMAAYKALDTTNEEEVRSAMDFAITGFGSINVVLACAGIVKDAFFVSPDKETGKVKKFMTTDQFQSVLAVNLTGVFLTLREAAIRMIDHNWKGVLIPVSSINKAGELGQLNYASSKAAIALWPKILAGEFHAKAIKNIRVAAIAPGYVETPMLTSIKPEILAGIVSGIPIGRLVQTHEIISTIRFIIENEAIHGTTLEIAGGIIAKGLAK